jgi:multisubunit Na+/H+ antiporter MnhG subunit
VERARRNLTIVLGTITALLGVVMIVSALAHGGAPIAIGVIVGAAFMLLGSARVWLALGPGSDSSS